MKLTPSVLTHTAEPGFNGELHESSTGWQILGNGYRVYNPVLMRFHSPDSLSPFGEGSLNAYAYCNADPINAMDPTGHVIKLQLSLGKYFFSGSERVKSVAFQQSRVLRVAGDDARSAIKVAAQGDIDTIKAVFTRNYDEKVALGRRYDTLYPGFENTQKQLDTLRNKAWRHHENARDYSDLLESIERTSGNLYITENAYKVLSSKALKIREIETWRAAHLREGQKKLKID